MIIDESQVTERDFNPSPIWYRIGSSNVFHMEGPEYIRNGKAACGFQLDRRAGFFQTEIGQYHKHGRVECKHCLKLALKNK